MSTSWTFLLIVVLSGMCFTLGRWIGGRPGRSTVWVGVVTVAMMLGWVVLQRQPMVAVQAIPAQWLRYVETTAVGPLFMLIVGLAMGRSTRRGQHRMATLAAGLGLVYLLQGGLWMMQATPASVLGATVGGAEGPLVRQSQSYSCVAAAGATLLNLHGVPTSERWMAELTHTRAGTGSTLVRAIAGLNDRLEGSRRQAVLLRMETDELAMLDRPVLLPIRSATTYHHMVVLLRVTDTAALVADPANGLFAFDRAEFDRRYLGHVVMITDP